MSLATRCTACGTVFRIVQDQLKVSEGWVRCGRCNVVFNALEGLFDLERDGLPASAQPAAPTEADADWVRDEDAPRDVAPAADAARETVREADAVPDTQPDAARTAPARADAAPALADDASTVHAPERDGIADHDAGADAREPGRAHAALDRVRAPTLPRDRAGDVEVSTDGGDDAVVTGDDLAHAAARYDDDDEAPLDTEAAAAAASPTSDTPQSADTSDAALPRVGTDGETDLRQPDAMTPDDDRDGDTLAEPADARLASPSLDGDEAPGFVRRARREERWRTPAMRAALGTALLVLVAVLALQIALHFRDTVAARWPATRPALLAACGGLGCTVEAPRRVDDVTVESSTLARAATPDAFRLSVVLRNRGAWPVAMPSVDLSLTDPEGQLIARRVLTPRDFRVASAVLAPGTGTPLQLVLTAGTPRVAGYTVEIFYP